MRRPTTKRLRCALGGLLFAASGAAAQDFSPTPIERTSLSNDPFATGLLDRGQGALERNLWEAANADAVGRLLEALPARPVSPSVGRTMRRILLTAGESPAGATSSLGGRKLLALARAGFVDEARTVASLSNASNADPWVGRSLAIADLLADDVDAACGRGARLRSGGEAAFWARLRVFCDAADERYDAADLTLGILREQGALSDLDDELLSAVAIPAPIDGVATPENALHLAIARKLGAPLGPRTLDVADAGVLAALADDADLDPAFRIAASQRLAAMGVIDGAALRGVYAALPAETEEIADAPARAEANAADVVADALLYRHIETLSAPEFVRDRAETIAATILRAPSFQRRYAAALAHAPDVTSLEGVLVSTDAAGAFAEARMAVGDGAGAATWLMAMLGRGLSGLDEGQQLRFIELTNLLAMIDPKSGADVSAAANVSIDPTALVDAAAINVGADDRQDFAATVDAAFAGALGGSPGQAGLAALVLSDGAYADDPAARVVAGRALDAAGLADVARGLAFERAWRATFPETTAASVGGGERGFAPRLKPKKKT